MKKLTGFAALLMLLLGAWSGAGWYLLRGAGAYRLHTTLGNVFAVSWQYTALAAVLLAVILLAALIRRIRRKKNAPLQAAAAGETAAAPAQEPAPKEGFKFGKKNKKTPDAPAEEKIAPAAAETELMDAGETVLMGTEEKIPPARGVTAGRCAVCGAKLKEGARFCVECGAKVIGGGV